MNNEDPENMEEIRRDTKMFEFDDFLRNQPQSNVKKSNKNTKTTEQSVTGKVMKNYGT